MKAESVLCALTKCESSKNLSKISHKSVILQFADKHGKYSSGSAEGSAGKLAPKRVCSHNKTKLLRGINATCNRIRRSRTIAEARFPFQRHNMTRLATGLSWIRQTIFDTSRWSRSPQIPRVVVNSRTQVRSKSVTSVTSVRPTTTVTYPRVCRRQVADKPGVKLRESPRQVDLSRRIVT